MRGKVILATPGTVIVWHNGIRDTTNKQPVIAWLHSFEDGGNYVRPMVLIDGFMAVFDPPERIEKEEVSHVFGFFIPGFGVVGDDYNIEKKGFHPSMLESLQDESP